MITLIRNGLLVSSEGVLQSDLWIDGDTIAAVGSSALVPDRTVDADGCYVFPGGIDPHVHMEFTVGEFTSTDSFETGTRAAAFGGVTTIIDFAVPAEGESSSEAVVRRTAEANGSSAVDFGIHAVITRVDADLPVEIQRCLMLGVPDFKTFTTYTGLRLSMSALLSVMGCVQAVGGLIMVHAEDDDGIQQRLAKLVQRGQLTSESHFLSRPAEVESTAVRDVLELQNKTQCSLHFVHISAADSVEQILDARQLGVDVSAETCPHYLLTTASVYRENRAPLFMVSPAIKEQTDQDRLWEGLREAPIDIVATDHCPFTTAQKLKYSDFRQTPTGLPGVETTLPLLFTAWRDRDWPLERLVGVLSTNAAKRFGLYPRKGSLLAGADADIVIYSPEPESSIHSEHLHMNVDWSPFEGYRIRGAVRDVLLRGQALIEGGNWVGGTDLGQFVRRTTQGSRSGTALGNSTNHTYTD